MTKDSQAMLDITNQLKSLCTSIATGGARDGTDYGPLRQQLMSRLERKHLPDPVVQCRSGNEFWGYIKKFSTYEERRQHIVSLFNDLLTHLEQDHSAPSDSTISDIIRKLDLAYITETWKKALERRETDPDGAITIGRTLLETTCKHILELSSVAYSSDADLPSLYKKTANALRLAPEQHQEEIIKQIMSGCISVVSGIGAIRNKASDAHGRGISATRLTSRHSTLVVNLSGALSQFLLETHLFHAEGGKS